MKLWLALFATSLFVPLSAVHGMAFMQTERVPAEKTPDSNWTGSPEPIGQQASDDQGKNEPTSVKDILFYFSFEGASWSDVIPWFADQAEFSLQKVESWPKGTFTFRDRKPYTTLGALDELNRSLAELEVPYTLIRNRNMLTLKPAKEASVNKELIDPVIPKPIGQQASAEQDKYGLASEKLIYFTLQDASWSDVIPWFADQAEFSLQDVESFPKGTFNLKDKEGYTKLGALDALNRSLARLEVPYTLIRNRTMLTLKPIKEAITMELIDSVKPEDLDDRGSYELLSVMFDLEDLDGPKLVDELKSAPVLDDYVSDFYFIESSNQLQVRGTGARLQEIRGIIETANKRLAAQQLKTIEYNLKFEDAGTFIPIVGAQLGIPEGRKSNKDGTITIVSQPLSSRLFVSGTQQMLDRFASIAKIVDSDPNAPTGMENGNGAGRAR